MKNRLINALTSASGTNLNSKRCFTVLLLALSLLSCSIIAPFDEFTLNESYTIKKEITVLYQLLEDAPPEKRQYELFRRDYAYVVASLSGLLDRQKIRKKNEETTKIVEQILEFLVKYRDAHKEQDTYKDAQIKLHSKRLDGLMKALIVAEEAKKR
jgi:hypothetical protein